MKHGLRNRAVSLTLIFAVLFSGASCRRKSTSKEHRKIRPEDPWFDSEVIHIAPDVDTGGKDYSYKEQILLGSDDKNIVVLSRAYLAEDKAMENNVSCFVTVLDHDTCEEIHTTDMDQFLPEQGNIENIDYSHGRITATVADWDSGTRVDIDIDGRTGEKTGEREHATELDSSGFKSMFRAGKYTVLVSRKFDDKSFESYFALDIESSEGEQHHVEVRKEHTSLTYISAVFSLDEDKLLVPATPEQTTIPIFFEVDIKKEESSEADGKDYEWIDLSMINDSFGGKDGQLYFSTTDGISRIDLQNKRIERYFDYDACLINHCFLGDTQMIDCSDGKIIFLGGRRGFFAMGDPIEIGFDLYVLTKASENPHAGKTVLELYATNGYVDPVVSEAIIRFNSTNKDFIIEVTDEYKVDNVLYQSSSDTADDTENALMKRNLSLNDALAMNIVSGTGPDILIITDDMGRLNNSNYLMDLNSYFGNMDADKYFGNIIDAAKIDGKLYQLPLSFGIKGIHTDSKYAGASGVGFTTSEYEEFLYGPLNGYDLFDNGQAMYFVTLFNAMRDRFIVNGKADFTGSEFFELADYVKKNVSVEARPVMPPEDEDPASEMREYVHGIAQLSLYEWAPSYLAAVNDLNGARSILGIPSSDGRGPLVCPNCSVAVSARAKDTDACVDFLKILLSDEILYEMAKTSGFTISREAYRKTEETTLEYINGPRGNDFSMSFGMPSEHRMKFTKDDMAELERIISSCSYVESSDSSINLILIEEMPAYFLGQKDLTDVIRILQDRVQKVLDERA